VNITTTYGQKYGTNIPPSIGENFGSDFRLVAGPRCPSTDVAKSLPSRPPIPGSGEPRAVGLPGVQRGNGKSHGKCRNSMDVFFLGENHGKIEENPLSMEV